MPLREKPETPLRLNTEKGVERQTELSLHREIEERLNVLSRQRMAAVLPSESKLCSKVAVLEKKFTQVRKNKTRHEVFAKQVTSF